MSRQRSAIAERQADDSAELSDDCNSCCHIRPDIRIRSKRFWPAARRNVPDGHTEYNGPVRAGARTDTATEATVSRYDTYRRDAADNGAMRPDRPHARPIRWEPRSTGAFAAALVGLVHGRACRVGHEAIG